MLGHQFGTLEPRQQSVCNPSLRNATLVSVISFNRMGGPKTIFARRVQPTLLEISFTHDVDDSPERTRGTLATIPIPADARVVDAVQDIRGPGKEGPLDCSVSASSGAAQANAIYNWADEVTLNGTVIAKEVLSSRGGSIKTPLFIPDQPINLRKARPEANESEVTSARELWIGNIVDASGKPSTKPSTSFVGRKVTFRGHFVPSSTGHHHSHPWLDGQLSLR